MLTLTGYQTTDLIYDGTRTLVYRGVKTDDAGPAIIKKLRKEYPTFNELLQFRHQYVLSKNLDIPGIVRPIALEKYGNGYVLVMEDVGGVSLSEYCSDRPLAIEEFLQVAIAITQILENLYRNRIIHKDIKPANILINPETKEIYLIDFSISSILPRESQEIQNPNVLEGTLAYISPEQTGRMNRGIDYRSDFYSLGATFYELLTGEVPFKSDDPMELVHCHIAKTPTPPHEVKPEIPLALSDLVMKLMAKTAEERYQSALGIKYDLEKCRQQWQETGSIAEFKLGSRDISDRFLIPEKLYGREKEVSSLLSAFDRVAAGTTEFMLVAGFSGIGKTAVVNEVHKPIVRQRGYFILGKFDQFQRNIPYFALVVAFRDLMGQLTGESDAQLEAWKSKILDALGENAGVIIEVIPELEEIIGKQPDVTELSGSASQNRFNLLFGKFIRVFTTSEHPLVIFIDDLQWADSASLKLMQLLMEDSETGYLLLLGAYRDNEVFPAHPLMLSLEEIAKSGATIDTITLEPLSQGELGRLVADTLCCSLELALPLTELVYQKTEGNPFFATQFLKSLHEDGWIAFNFELGYWQCDMTRVRELALRSDVVEFMAARLHKLPEDTCSILKLAACIGNQFDLGILAIVWGQPSVEVATVLWRALQEGLILPLSETYKFYQQEDTNSQFPIPTDLFPNYKFLHDRVQQAAYSLIPQEQKQKTHYRIGKLLLAKVSPEEKQERIFELVNQLNYGTSLITEQQERDELAQLNLIACRKARSATAYETGREYAKTGLSLLGEDAWSRQYETSLALHELAAELAALCGDIEAMEQSFEIVLERARSLLDLVNIYEIKIQSKVTQFQLVEAIAASQHCLQQLGVTFPESPTPDDIRQAIREVEALMVDRDIEDLIDLPMMADRQTKAIVQIVNSTMPAASISGSPLFPLLVSLSVKLAIQAGNTPFAAVAYAFYGIFACNILQNVDMGIKFARVALESIAKPDTKALKPNVLTIVAFFLLHRKFHLKSTLAILQEGYTAALEVGNLEFVGYTAHQYCFHAFLCGELLEELEKKTHNYYNKLVQLNQVIAAHYCRLHWQPILSLLGAARPAIVLFGDALQEKELLSELERQRDSYGLFFGYLYKLMLCLLFGEIASAKNCARELEKHLEQVGGTNCETEFYFYDSLATLADLSPQAISRSSESLEELKRVEQNQTQFQQNWVRHAPMNHLHKWQLVEAERYRVLGNKTEAIELYDKAIAGAKANEYMQEQALANELAAKFYLEWGKEKVAAGYMQDAYYCYARWGAKAKVDDLEKRYPTLLATILERERLALSSSATVASLSAGTISHTSTGTGEILDLAALMKASRTLSEDISLEGAIANLMKVTRENAGAETAALMLFQEKALMLTALVKGEDAPNIDPIPVEASNAVPASIVNKVKRSRKPLVLDNASKESAIAGDAYIKQHQPLSILCLPLADRSRLIGILYLENNRVAGAFTRDRLEVLSLLSSQAAISLENARLYQKSQNYAQQLEQTQLQLVQSEKMATVGQLTAGVAHEINNPVGFISGNLTYTSGYFQDLINLLNLYRETFPQPGEKIEEEMEAIELDYLIEDLPQTIDSMKEGIDRITEISKSMRTFSRGDTAKKIPFNIHDGIDSTLLILKHRLKANVNRPEIEIVKNYGNLPEVRCYPGQLNQVFMNIIANAIDAFDEGNIGRSFEDIKAAPNRIAITTKIDKIKQVAMVEIKDNGIGMSEIITGKVFEHLFTTKGVGKGTGLGLSISRQIVEEKHGGKISLTSAEGKGTEFCIALPL